MTARSLYPLIFSLIVAARVFAAEPAPFLLKGKVGVGREFVFNVKPAAGRAEWLALGESIEGYTLASFDHPTETLTLTKGETVLRIAMDIGVIGTGTTVTPADRKQQDRERMLRMKPALEAGRPIRGDVVTIMDGKAASQSVEFVIGKKTVLEGGEGKSFEVTPDLNADGSVSYKIDMINRTTEGATTRILRNSIRVVTTPWGSFNVMGADHGFGFAPTGADTP